MKKALILFAALWLTTGVTSAQTIENIDFFSGFNENLAAIKKDNQWAFINNAGELVIPFRNDLVASKLDDGSYPIFKNGRCLIKKEIDGITYFGFINNKGKTIIEPIYLNATNFTDNEAIVLKLLKDDIGTNNLLSKNIISYTYFEVTIDTNGVTNNYLTPKGFHVTLDKQHLQVPPKIVSKQISKQLYAIYNTNKKWTIMSIK